jgi:hypothetical protein
VNPGWPFVGARAVSQRSISASVVRITGIALGWRGLASRSPLPDEVLQIVADGEKEDGLAA